MKDRIYSIDILRAISAMGVLWIHTWTLCGNPRWYVGPIDISALMAIGGNGVDFFFVISGFCMYYFYGQNQYFSWDGSVSFIKKRWIRISPAFYFATLFYIFYNYLLNGESYILNKILTSIFYLNNLSPYNAEGFFWSLGTEFQFYLVLPLLLFLQYKIGFCRSLIVVWGGLSILMIVAIIYFRSTDVLTSLISFRFGQFAFGIITAKLFIQKKHDFGVYKLPILFIFILISYLGRLFISKGIMDKFGEFYNLSKLFGLNLMSLGFAGVLYFSLLSKRLNDLSIYFTKKLSLLGAYSYSFYLWHGIIHQVVVFYFIKLFPKPTILDSMIYFFISFIVLIPISYVSYMLLEKPFFKKIKKTKTLQSV